MYCLAVLALYYLWGGIDYELLEMWMLITGE